MSSISPHLVWWRTDAEHPWGLPESVHSRPLRPLSGGTRLDGWHPGSRSWTRGRWKNTWRGWTSPGCQWEEKRKGRRVLELLTRHIRGQNNVNPRLKPSAAALLWRDLLTFRHRSISEVRRKAWLSVRFLVHCPKSQWVLKGQVLRRANDKSCALVV